MANVSLLLGAGNEDDKTSLGVGASSPDTEQLSQELTACQNGLLALIPSVPLTTEIQRAVIAMIDQAERSFYLCDPEKPCDLGSIYHSVSAKENPNISGSSSGTEVRRILSCFIKNASEYAQQPVEEGVSFQKIKQDYSIYPNMLDRWRSAGRIPQRTYRKNKRTVSSYTSPLTVQVISTAYRHDSTTKYISLSRAGEGVRMAVQRRINAILSPSATIDIPDDGKEGDYQDHPDFADDEKIAGFFTPLPSIPDTCNIPKGTPSHLEVFYRTPLLGEHEKDFFLRYNFLKYHLRHQNPPNPTEVKNAIKEVRDRIVTANLRLVASIVKRYIDPSFFPFEDLYAEGYFVLMRAVEKFDVSRDCAFSTYLTKSINLELRHYVAGQRRQLQRFSASGDESDLDACTGPDISRSHEVWVEDTQKRVREAVARLPECDKRIIEGRYGLGDSEPQSQKELGGELGISHTCVGYKEKEALQQLRNDPRLSDLAPE
jgi:RNA polymerase primary sigma factor